MIARIAPLAAIGLFSLLGLNAWLLTVVTTEPASEQETAAVATAWRPKPLPPQARPHHPKPIAAYGQTLAKPLFFKDRRPYAPPPPPPPPRPKPKPVVARPPPPVDPGLVLGGIMITNGARKAYVYKKADSRGMWLSKDDAIMGWKLLSIDTMSARLEQGSRSIELQLYPPR